MTLHNERGERLFTTAQAAQYLGVAVSTVDTQVRTGRLAVDSREGRRMYFAQGELDRYKRESKKGVW